METYGLGISDVYLTVYIIFQAAPIACVAACDWPNTF